MNNRDRFFEAFGHTEHRVMGRRLRRFTLRHRFWLEALKSPLVSGGEATMMDLELATRICALPFDELETGVPRMIERGPRRRDKLGYLLRVFRRRVAREYADFQAYLLDHGCPPAVYGGGVEECGTPGGEEIASSSVLPGLLGLVSGLIRCGWSDPEKVWSLSPGEAEWYLTAGLLHRGVDVKVKTPHDEQFEAHIAKLKEEKRRAVEEAKQGAE